MNVGFPAADQGNIGQPCSGIDVESPRTTKHNDRTQDRLTQHEESRSFIGPAQRLVVLVPYLHVLLLISTIHIKRCVSMAVALWMFSSAFAICFVRLMMYRRPFRSGGSTVGFVGIEMPVVE